MKHGFSIILSIILAALSFGSAEASVLKGRVISAETGEPLPRVLVSFVLSTTSGGSFQNTVETDSTGRFKIKSDYEGHIVLTFKMLGYKFARKVDYMYGAQVSDTLSLGDVRLRPTALMLKEVQVTASVPRMTMSGDTIVFNPSAFKLKDGDKLEELIRKLPGVESRNGALYWNNKPLRLMMNGKNVFGGDAIITQLPAEVAGKIKLYESKSELARHTGRADGTEDHVLDIQIKPGFLDKWYGYVEGNYIAKDHYMGKLQANMLSDRNPQIVYFKANNENQLVERTDGRWHNNAVDKYGKDIFGAYNYERNWKKKDLQNYSNSHFDLSASFGHADGWGTTFSNRETFFTDAEHTFSMGRTRNSKHSLKPKLSAELFAYTDAKNSVKVNAEAVYEKARTTEETDGAKFVVDDGRTAFSDIDAAMSVKAGEPLYDRLVTRNRNYATTESQARSLKVTYEWNHYIGNKGLFRLSGLTKVNNDKDETSVNRKLEYVREGSAETLRQYYNDPYKKTATELTALYAYWLSSKLMLNAWDMLSYERLHRSRSFYEDGGEGTGSRPTTLDADNCHDYKGHSLTNVLGVSLVYSPSSKVQITPGVNWNWIRRSGDIVYGRLDSSAVRINHTVDPSFAVKWKMGRTRNLDFGYSYVTQLPNLYETFGWRNTIDPLYTVMGNPDIQNSHVHNAVFNYSRLWPRKQAVLTLTASYARTVNPMATLYRYNQSTGVYTAMGTNVKGGDTYGAGINYEKGIGVYVQVKNRANASWSNSYGYLTVLDDGKEPEQNKQRLFTFTDNMSVSYEANKLQASLFASLVYSRYRYSDRSYNSDPVYLEYGGSARFSAGPFEANMRVWDDFRSGYKASEMNRHRIMSTANVEYVFNRRKCRVGLSADDIFNQARDFNSTYSAYERSETWSESFHHYVAVTFSYRFEAKAKKNK